MKPLFIDFQTIDTLTPRQIGIHDIPCPLCGPWRRAAVNKRRLTLRIWRLETDFATYHCARCGSRGYARESLTQALNLQVFARVQTQVADRERATQETQRRKARWLWRGRLPAAGSIVERYLRDVRGYGGGLPKTLGYLPARGEYPPAMIAGFGFAEEVEPGLVMITDESVKGIHLTRLRTDGSGKAGTDADKIMIGNSAGFPIVMAPPNDLLGLIITEGIEDALSVHEATGIGTWAAGSASRLPGLANAIPTYIENVTIIADDDRDGRRHAAQLADRLKRNTTIETHAITLGTPSIAA